MKAFGYRWMALVIILAAWTTGARAENLTGFPAEVTVNGHTVLVYAPKIDSWQDYSRISGRLPVTVKVKGKSRELVGVLSFTGDTEVNQESRSVVVTGLQVTQADFPGINPALANRIQSMAAEALPAQPLVIPLDLILKNMKDIRIQTSQAPRQIPPAPLMPDIFVSLEPAILVQMDGDPILTPIKGTDITFVVNTNWDLFFILKESAYYLLNQTYWLTAPDLNGPWTAASLPPAALGRLPEEDRWHRAREAFRASGPAPDRPPRVLVSTRPAELIVIEGQPALSPIPGTGLLDVVNTQSDLFLYARDGQYYYLVAGRWFAGPSLDGPWSEVAGKDLPADFALIPPDHPRAGVLASVPGTRAAEEAVVMSQIPTKATVLKHEAKAESRYAGVPEFASITGTALQYAVNSPNPVILVGSRYYMLYQGVWFVSDDPQGPWTVAGSVPEAVYGIPPSSPLYNVTYVRVYDSTPDQVVVGYTPGYWGAYLCAGTVVFGTGFYYPPVVSAGMYYPYPPTYGLAARYYPGTGVYVSGGAYYGPYGGISGVTVANPYTGGYIQTSGVWGPYAGSWTASGYSPVTGIGGVTHQSYNPYAQWGSSVVTRGDDWIATGHVAGAPGAAAGFVTSTGAAGAVFKTPAHSGGAVKTTGGDLYVGVDGNIYKNTGDGWSKYDNGSWNQVNPQVNPQVPTGQAAALAGVQNPQFNSGQGTQGMKTTNPAERTTGGRQQVQDTASGTGRPSSPAARQTSSSPGSSRTGSGDTTSPRQSLGPSSTGTQDRGGASTRSRSGASGDGIGSGTIDRPQAPTMDQPRPVTRPTEPTAPRVRQPSSQRTQGTRTPSSNQGQSPRGSYSGRSSNTGQTPQYNRSQQHQYSPGSGQGTRTPSSGYQGAGPSGAGGFSGGGGGGSRGRR